MKKLLLILMFFPFLLPAQAINGLYGREILKTENVEAEGNGVVILKICVGKGGHVISTKLSSRSTIKNEKTINKCLIASLNYLFESSKIEKQCGVMTFKFE